MSGVNVHSSKTILHRLLLLSSIALAITILSIVNIPTLKYLRSSVMHCSPACKDSNQLQKYSDSATLISGRSQGIRKVSSIDSADIFNCSHVQVPHDLFIPIFILTRDRVSTLRDALHSYRRAINSPHEIIILDHNSTFPPMIEYLNELKTTKEATVVSLAHVVWSDALQEACQYIKEYLELRQEVSFYVFTDPDIALLRAAPDILLFYAGILKSCPSVRGVGPALQISDIPSHYEKKNAVYNWESQFWTGVPNMVTWNGIGYHVAWQPIDTTFVMYRRDEMFRRLTGSSLRSYAPYSSVHLDWYENSGNLTTDKIYYLQRQSGINHW